MCARSDESDIFLQDKGFIEQVTPKINQAYQKILLELRTLELKQYQ